ncbi:mediator of RNA polymerase II transcription subunit 1-like isoform X3 [Syngnathoides biaculeatus]|uniref:mediator of RNA polymerase II transcription subunit 1-like isoform X3 n=1 Tax=Syngnathoides biaculeatus TaxID=300417 RepID=UPI002ADE3236|nr:mediator of RNA polymerase II transcription subunit 1-like isoform X3 [Syngnathoides biaculeatus]
MHGACQAILRSQFSLTPCQSKCVFPHVAQPFQRCRLQAAAAFLSSQEQPRQPPLPSLERLQEAFNGSCVYTTRCRLEAVAKEQGMGFHFSEATCYLTAELFYLEVALLPCGGVDDVKVAPHGGAPVSSESLLRPLSSSKDFAEFSAELRDLVSHQVKFNLFTALQHLAKDMRAMLQLARAGNDGSPRTDTPNDGLLGCLIAGEADRPLTVQFYALPSADANFGETQAAQVAVVSSDVMHKLQMAPVVQPPLRLDPEGFPVSSSTSEVPHEMFPACFALRLRPAVPVLTTFVDKIKQITDVAVPDVELQWAQFPTLLPRGSKGFQSPEEHQDRIFTVPLPGDTPHVYVFPGAAWNAARHAGTLTDCVRFTGPAHVPRLLEVLRHQCAINALLRSCTSPAPVSDCERRFEVRPEGDDGFSVTFQWPNTDSLALLLVNIPDSHQITCRLYVAGIGESSLGEFVSAVMKRSMSVPVTLQMLYGKIESAAAAPADSEKVPSTPPRVATDDPSSASQTSARRLPDVGVGPAPDAPAAVSPDWLTTNGQP